MIFLNLVLDGQTLKGNATMQGFEGQIELQGAKWDAEASVAVRDQAIKTSFKKGAISLTKQVDSASAVIYSRLHFWKKTSNKPMFEKATITMVDPTLATNESKAIPFLTIVLEDCLVSDVRIGQQGLLIEETIELGFKSGTIKFDPPNPRLPGARESGRTVELHPATS